ncbi:host specificity protein, partial [Pseudomonas entomophila]|uniref:TipJ family phage tail tip protein n=1 Tax=Pseudomonas entomophila TaxID=312306 RepID=UPI0015E3AC63|nr:host specificity protein [Pseudomonas entomophila]
MGEVPHLEITGAKGGESKPKSPVEAPDSLQSTNIAKILLAVGEGEFEGKPTDRDIYLDNTPIMDASGNVNFPGVKWEWRSGSVEQSYIQGIPAVENENSVGVELRSDSPFTRALSDTKLSAVRVRLSWPRLLSQDSNGNTNGYRIEYAIDIATDGGAYVEAHRGAVDGKSANGYQRSIRVNLPASTSGWMMRVRRITPNANKGAIADTMTVAGYTEIIDEKLCYPNTALLYIEFDAQQFQNIPAVTVKCKAKRWPVPSNYDPIARTYTGIWDGTFKQAWTNNPAFVTYGLCVEDRFGLGKRIKPWMVDKWEMYRIAQYCDQRVPDGVGGTEPRFLCDMNLQGRSEAWVLLRDLSAIYRGMVYWAHGALFMQADMPRSQDIDYVFTRSNVVGGDFVYGGAERNSHYSRALVSYDNPANNYETDVIPSTDVSLQRRFRDRPIEISAIGCTRASEAQRRGKWALLSNSQDRTVTFRTGMEGRIPLPGYVIPVADELVAGRPNGGRISAVAGLVITLDRDTPIKAGDRLIVNLPNGTAQARTVRSVSGRAVTVTTAYSTQPEAQLQWAIDYQDLAVQLFRVLRTTRTDKGQYEITALEFNPSKFAAIDTGAKLDERPISVIPVTTVQPPASVTLASSYMIDQGIAVNTMTISWAAVAGAVAYEVEWRKDNGNWVRLQRAGATSIDVTGIYAGAYLAQVRAVSAYDISSTWKSSVLTQLNGKKGLPPSITSLTAESLLFAIGLAWAFPPGAEDTQRTELWYSEGTDLAKATKLADLAYPQDKHTLQGLRAGQRFYFWARLVDKSGNIGPWFPSGTTLVAGMASADAGPILEQIKDQITASELGKALTSEIEKIKLIDGNGPGSVNERVGSAKTELARQISDVNNTLAGVKSTLEGQVSTLSKNMADAKSELQQQITAVSTLAGSLPYRKDKTYSTNQSALGSDGKLYQALKAVPLNTPPPNATYWTDVGQAVVTAAGTAASVTKLQTDVTTLGDKVTATSGKVDGFQASLNTTNDNVAKKADASAVNSLKLTVDQQGRDLTSQGSTLSGMQTAIDGKASSQALTQVTSRVTATEDKDKAQDQLISSQSQTLTSLKDTVDKKADSSTVQSLSNEVKQQGQTLTSQGQSLVAINSTIGQLGGENWIYNPSFEKPGIGGLADGWARAGGSGVTVNPSIVPSALASGESAQRIDVTGVSTSAWARIGNPGNRRIKVSPGTAVTLSAYARGTAGLGVRCEIQFLTSDGSGISGTPVAANTSVTADYARLSHSAVAPQGTVECNFFVTCYGTAAISSAFLEVDRCQLEFSPSMSGWRDNGAVNVDAAAAVSSAVQSLSGRVDQTESSLTSQSGSITQLTNSLTTTDSNVSKAQKAAEAANSLAGGKGKVIVQAAAPATADQAAQNLWIDTTGNGNTPKRWTGSAWAAVTDKVATEAAAAAASALSEVAKKADASAVSAMKSTVDQQGRDITAQGSSLTRIDASLANLGASGVNLLPAEYSVFGKTPPTLAGSSYAATTVADSAALRGYALKFDWSTTSSALTAFFSKATNLGDANMGAKRQKYIVSYYAKASVAGHVIALYLRGFQNDGSSYDNPGVVQQALTAGWTRYSYVADMSASAFAGSQMILAIQLNRSGVANRSVWVDRIMVEPVVNGATEPSTYVPGNSFDQSLANAAATAALDAKVTVSEGAITSASGQITELRNSIGDVGGENLIYNPSFEKPGTNGLADGWAVASGSGATVSPSVVASALNPKEWAQRINVTGLSASVWARIGNPGNRRVALKPGTPVTFSAYMRGTAGLNARPEIQFLNSAGSGISGPVGSFTVASGEFARISLSAVVPDGTVECNFFVTCYGTDSISTAFMEVDRAQLEQSSRATGWRDNGQVIAGDQSATSQAVDSLTSTTTKQGEKIESVSDRATFLENTISSPANGLGSKASTTALNQLGGRVTQTERDIYAAGGTLTDITSKLNAIGGAGSNLLPAQYSTFSERLPGIHSAAQVTTTAQKDDSAYSGYLLKADSSAGSGWLYLADSAANYTLRLVPGKRYIFSAWMKGSAAHNVAVRLRYQNTSGGATEVGLGSVDVSTTLARVSCVITAPGALTGPASLVFYTQNGSAAGTTWFDGVMLEEKVGEASAPSSFTPGNSANQMIAQANAVFALDTAVSKQGEKLTVTADGVTKLTGDLGKTSGALQDEQKLRIEADSA